MRRSDGGILLRIDAAAHHTQLTQLHSTVVTYTVVFVGGRGSRGTSPSLDLTFPPTALSENLGGNGKGEGKERGKGGVGRPPALLPPTGFCLKYHPGDMHCT